MSVDVTRIIGRPGYYDVYDGWCCLWYKGCCFYLIDIEPKEDDRTAVNWCTYINYVIVQLKQ